MKWMYFLVLCATVADRIHARPGPNEFTHSNSINATEASTPVLVPAIPSVFTKDDESIIRRYLQRLNNSRSKNIEEYDGSNNNILNDFLKISIDDLKQNRFTSIHSTIDPDSEPSKSYQIAIPNRYYEYEINEPEPGYINVPHNSRPQTAIFTNIKPVFELENINPYPTRYGGVVRPTFVTTPTEATLISPLYHHTSPTKVTKYHLITPKPVFNVRPTHRPYVNVYGYDPSDPDPNYDDEYNQLDSLDFDNNNGYNNQPFNVKKKKKKKCPESPTNQYDPDCESFKLTLSQNVETTTAGHVIKIPNKGTSTHDNKLDLATFDEKQKDPICNGGCCDGTCTEPYPPVPIPNRPFFPPLNPLPFPQVFPFPTPNALPLPIPQQIAPIAPAPVSQTRPILSIIPGLVSAGLSPLGLINKQKPKPDDDDDGFDLDFFDFDLGGMKFGFKKIMKKLWPLAPYLFALNPFSLGFWTVVFSPVLLVVAGGTAVLLFLYPWVSKMLVHTRQSSSVIVHKHPGKRPPAPGPWRVSPHQGNGVKWTIKPKPKAFQFPRRKKRYVHKYSNNHEIEDDYGTQNTNMDTIEMIAQTEPKTKSDEISVQQHQPKPIDLNTVSTGTLLVDEKRHLGVAVPVTMEEIEKEMASQTNIRESSTSKDGISTWILLSGTNPTAPPPNDMSRSGSSAENQKVDKIAKVRDNSKAPNKVVLKAAQNNKNKNKPKATTPLPPSDSKETNDMNKVEKLSEPVPIVQTPILKAKKKPATTTTTTTQSPLEEETTYAMEENMISTTTKETPVPFLVLEPKDADFDLPQDRSPGKATTKKPKRNNNKNKKKNNKKPNVTAQLDDVKNATKTAIKKKENPLGTKIYNYLSREVMPTAAVGLLGLVVTAGLAGYFLGPLGALRRSYDVADRKYDLYYYNNEEYAGTDGQSEEEVFGKVIAGMPLSTNYRNNIRPNNQRPNYYHQGQNPSKHPQQYNYRYRNSGNQQFQQQQQQQQQQPAHHPAQLSYSSYGPNAQNHAANYQRIHNVAPASQNVVSRKSISNPIFAIQPSSTSTTIQSTETTALPATVVHDINKLSHKDSDDEAKSSDIMEEDNPNELKKRTQFVVGSVFPESNVMDTSDDRDKTVMVPEHGPRRRRSIDTNASTRKSVESDVKSLEESYENLKNRTETSEKNEQIVKEMKHIDYEMNRLRRVIAEIKDIEQFQDELHIKGKNRFLIDTVSNGVHHITGDIKFVNELLDNPTEIDSKIANREAMMRTVNGEKPINDTMIQKKSDHMTTDTFEPTEQPSGIMGLLKILELKAAFGVNVLRSIRPAFDRAFADVFHAPIHQIRNQNQHNEILIKFFV